MEEKIIIAETERLLLRRYAKGSIFEEECVFLEI